jgi:hypothetical protein
VNIEKLREHLTGYRVPARQIGWLTRNGIPHFVNGAGRPVVTRASVEERAAVRVAAWLRAMSEKVAA